ncbi:medium-chain acyl-[acyl-carrier-protein] hydrolase [Streptomyces sp. 3211.6]|uniref:thioesterase II family protein n=1 Tax=Streptomyces TaxID=1883 RepID=UPI000CB013A3|nr:MULTISPECIES: alpha/beta fold hydrolase [Streptomyces]RKS97090.1 medium-chain acyl-[acyl-carrier-protein] hydrolase [Streptomyces sp. 3211.6]RPF25436.1 medium-chain acyl-[acyl-carrier-protein] hydrolase [Streptomyces sp. Ag109_G2-6]
MVASPWFLTSETAAGLDSDAVRVYCFAHAGGNPRTFLGWQPALEPDALVAAVCPPGRGHRFREPAPASLAALADGAAAAIARTEDRRGSRALPPFLLFGHSFGAALAFEVARRLDGVPGLAGLVASGCAAPSLLPTPRVVETARLEGRAFAEAVGFFGGLPPEVVRDEALQELLLPHLKADFRMVAAHRHRPGPPLTVPVTLLNGTDDPHVSPAALDPWSRECAAPPERHWAAGGHFYFEDRPDAATSLLRSLAHTAAASAKVTKPAASRPTVPGDQYVELI